MRSGATDEAYVATSRQRRGTLTRQHFPRTAPYGVFAHPGIRPPGRENEGNGHGRTGRSHVQMTQALAGNGQGRYVGCPTGPADIRSPANPTKAMETFRQDFRYAVRRLMGAPAFTATVITTLALGIGANTAIFSVVNGVLLSPLPYPDSDRLVQLNHVYDGSFEASVSARGFSEYVETMRMFEGLAAHTGWAANLTGVGEPERISAARVSAGYFRVLGVRPAQGRDFRPDEDDLDADRVVIVSDGFRRRRLGSAANAVGTELRLNGETYVIVGVMPTGFVDFFNTTAELWRPLSFTPEQLSGGWTNEFLNVVGRLPVSGSYDAANRELEAMAGRLKATYPDELPPVWSLRATPIEERAREGMRATLLVLLGAVGLVLLIACANVANLLLARASGRAKEVAIRAALGAARGRILRQLLTESVVLAVIGGGAGVLLALWGARLLGTALPAGLQPAIDVSVDGAVLAFAATLAVVTGLLFGLAPAVQLARLDVQHTLREGGRTGRADRAGQFLRRGLVVTEIALALALLAGAGLLVKSFTRLQSVNPGFQPDGLLTFNLFMPAAEYPNDTARIAFLDRALTTIRELPGVETVGGTSVLPFGGGWSTASFGVQGYTPGENEPSPWGDVRTVAPGYFEAMKIPLLRGRTFTTQDMHGSLPVAVIDEELAERYWPGQDPLGRHLSFDNADDPNADRYAIVGVVGHAAHESLDAEARVQFYRTYRQGSPTAISVVVRTTGRPTAMAEAVRHAVQSVDPNMPLSRLGTMEDLVGESVGQRRLSAMLFGGFALLALSLACLGIYGVMSYVVAQRRQEIGVRIALGAGAASVVGLLVKQGGMLVLAGLLFGLAGALALTRLLRNQLFGIEATDPATFAAVATLLLATALAATWLPAWRAANLDPVKALREE